MMKLHTLRAELSQLGCEMRRGPRGQEVWTSGAARPRRRVVLYGASEDIVPSALMHRVRKFRRGMMVYEYDERQKSC